MTGCARSIVRRRGLAPVLVALLALTALGGCQTSGGDGPSVPNSKALGLDEGPSVGDADEFLVVDCLLPAKVKRLGSQMTYLGPRRPIRTSAVDCEIRGGEYVAYDRADYRTALQVWLGAAEEGDPKAQTYVGEILERGVGGSPDYAAAAKWYRRAADQGHGPALINLGQLYEQGRGVEKDTVRALNLYREAAGFDEAGLTYVAATDAATELENLRSEVGARTDEAERLRAEIEKLESRLAALQAERESATRTVSGPAPPGGLEAAEAALEAERVRLDEERARSDRAFAEIERLRQELEDERARLEAEEQALEARRREAGGDRAARAEVERLLADLRERQRAFEERTEALDARAAEHDARAAALAERERELAAREADIRAREEALARREQAIEAKHQEVAELDREIAALRDEFERQRRELAALTAGDERVAVAAPAITLLDPQLPAATIRGMPIVRTRAGVSERQIIGKVDAPAGVLSLTVNDAPEDVNDQGLFEETVPVQRGGTHVRIVAIDERGRRAALDFVLQPEDASEEPVVAAVEPGAEITPAAATPEVPPVDFGEFHALVIGNNQHAHLPTLETAINDAEAVASLLEDKYGFEVALLRDATRYEILSTLNRYRANLDEDDNLLVYYAGHGELDQANQRGHWLPVDAEPDNTANWISNVAITDILNAMSAQRVLVVADSCYSGALTRNALARLQPGMSNEARLAWLRAMSFKRSRTAMTSGGLAPTLDSGGGEHSVFAKVFLEVLRENDGLIEGQRLFQEISARVTYIAQQFRFEQTPQYAPIKHAGHEAGEFFLVPESA